MSSSRDDFAIAIRSALLQRGARQKFSLFFLICLSVIIFFLESFELKFIKNIRSFLNDGVYRVSSIASAPLNFFGYVSEKTKYHIFIYNENQSLKKELEELREKDFQSKFLTAQNKYLKDFIKSSNDIENETILTKVILDKGSPFLKSILVNRGSRSGIKKGMPVVDGNYLVGRVVEVNYLSSRILLLNDLNSRIPVSIEQTASQAIITGYGKNEPKLEYLPENFNIENGKTVFTSGKDGIFPEGLPIGKLNKKDNGFFVKLFSDPNQLSFLSILMELKNEDDF